MREKVLKVLELYMEGGSLASHLAKVGMSKGDFYKTKREQPDLGAMYLDIQVARADMMVDENYQLANDVITDDDIDPRRARVSADIKTRIAEAFDRDRFGQNVKLNVSGVIDLTGALIEAKQRAALPGRNLEPIAYTEYETLPDVASMRSPDKQSGATLPAAFVDPFSDD